MRVFFDNCTTPVVAETLDGFLRHRKCGSSHIRDLPCGRHATDLEWMAYLAGTADDWLVVTGDRRIQKNKAERAAFRQAGLKGLVLASGYQTTPINQQASLLIWRWPDIEGLLKSLQPPFLFEMPMNRQAGFKQLPL